jgi:hypothetical protein
VSDSNPFGFGLDPEEIQRAMAQFADQAQKSQVVAWADNAINLAVQMTVASITRLELSGDPEQQARQVRQAIGVIFPEAVTLVREARQGLT